MKINAQNQTYSYKNSRESVLSLFQNSNFIHVCSKINQLGINNEELFQDYFFLNLDRKSTIVILTGLHGIEGYIGSEIIQSIFHSIKSNSLKLNHNLLLVHSLNPWGMSWYRRTNHNNVDLNRNSIFDESLKETELFHYKPFEALLYSKNKVKQILNLSLLTRIIAQKGIKNCTQVIAQGQYTHPMLLFYGGQEVQLEINHLILYLNSKFDINHRLLFMDIHSGLGEYAKSTIFSSGLEEHKSNFLKKNLSDFNLLQLKHNKKFYISKGMLENSISKKFNNQIYLTLEFGTWNSLKVLSNMITENYLYFTNKYSLKRAQLSLDTYFPYDQLWKSSCCEQALDLLNRLNSLHLDDKFC